MTDLFKENSQRILIYMSTEQQIDPFSKEVESTTLNALPIDALISDLSGESISYKTGGIITSNSKEIICEKKHRDLIKMSFKIEVDGEDFVGYKKNGAMQIRNLDSDYIRLYIHREK